MTAWVRRLPYTLDPLIAEAKRRARRRRLLGTVLILVLAGCAVGAVVGLSGSTLARSSAPAVPVGTRSPLPRLSGQAARAQLCFSAYNAGRYGGCHSPNGKWSIHVNHRIHCVFTVERIGTPHKALVRLPGSCAPLLWAGHSFLILRGLSTPRARLASLDPASHKVTALARFNQFIVSPNQRWIAGERETRSQLDRGDSYGARVIAVFSLRGHTCRVATRAASPKQDISVWKSPWSFRPMPGSSHPQDRVAPQWRTVRQGGRKIRVVSGPGTGFTRNSRGLIIAKWRVVKGWPFATRRRLVKFDLSSLHTPCPADLTTRG